MKQAVTKLQLLKKARDLIDSGAEKYVCCALGTAFNLLYFKGKSVPVNEDYLSESYRTSNINFQILTTWIMELLGGYCYYNSWLLARSAEARKMHASDLEGFARKCRETRLAWIDWMIQVVKEDK